MNRGFAVFIILALISVILSYVIPDNSKRGFTNALSSYMIADEENKLNYDDTREHLRVPAELPFEYFLIIRNLTTGLSMSLIRTFIRDIITSRRR